MRERDRDRGEAAPLDHQERSPAEQERDQRMVRLAQIGVLPAGLREERRELRERERSCERDPSADEPRRENESGGREPLRNDRRDDEDAGADDAADDDHRRVEGTERAFERHPSGEA